MASTSVLPLSTIVNVSITSSPSLPQVPNINTLAAIVQDAVPSSWASGQAFAQYVTLSQVGVDFGVNSNTYAIAQGFFAQQPNPLSASGYFLAIPRLQSPSLESVVACLERTGPLVYYFSFVIDQELTTSAPTTFARPAPRGSRRCGSPCGTRFRTPRSRSSPWGRSNSASSCRGRCSPSRSSPCRASGS